MDHGPGSWSPWSYSEFAHHSMTFKKPPQLSMQFSIGRGGFQGMLQTTWRKGTQEGKQVREVGGSHSIEITAFFLHVRYSAVLRPTGQMLKSVSFTSVPLRNRVFKVFACVKT